MIPILYDTDEMLFTTSGLARLRDCTSCVVTEERNGIYECDFEYPMTGANFDLIQIGRIIGVTHDDSGDIQPFDIVSYSKPIEGVVTFHCTHISYRQSYMTVRGSNINSLADAFNLFETAQPSNPFSYETDISGSGYFAAADKIPHSVRQMLGGMEGSVIDTYGGEYEWDKWTVYLHSSRGEFRDFSIRYGVNMLTYNDEMDISETYSSCIPYYANGEDIVVASKTDSGESTVTGRDECVPLDLTEKFENPPTKAELKDEAVRYMNANKPTIPPQNITVSFVRLQDYEEYADFQNLLRCGLCDTINVIFPDYGTNGNFKIVKVEWNALEDRYDEMELGALSVTLSEALGLSITADKTANTFQNLSVVNDLAVGGDAVVTGKLTATALDRSIFAVTEESVSASASGSGAITGSASVTKSDGYFPLGVVGLSVTSGGAYSRGCYLTNRNINSSGTGSCTINIRLQATSSGSKNCSAYVLWLKTSI